MINQIYSSIAFNFLSLFSLNEIRTKEKVIYLTFDDGPEPGITESILGLLNKYNARATFFCTGKNFERYPDLVQLIKINGHSLGNHTYSHLNGLKEDYKNYIDDVDRSKGLIQSKLFRPPWGVLSLTKFLKIRKENKIIMWSISSNDTKSNTNWNKHCQWMIRQTKPGSIVLFHFSRKHAMETQQIFPMYLNELYKLGYKANSIIG